MKEIKIEYMETRVLPKITIDGQEIKGLSGFEFKINKDSSTSVVVERMCYNTEE